MKDKEEKILLKKNIMAISLTINVIFIIIGLYLVFIVGTGKKSTEKSTEKPVNESIKKPERHYYGIFKIPPKATIDTTVKGYKIKYYRDEYIMINIIEGKFSKLLFINDNYPSFRLTNDRAKIRGLTPGFVKLKNVGKKDVFVDVEIKRYKDKYSKKKIEKQESPTYGVYKIPPNKTVTKTIDGTELKYERYDYIRYTIIEGAHKKILTINENIPPGKFRKYIKTTEGLSNGIIELRNTGQEEAYVEVKIKPKGYKWLHK